MIIFTPADEQEPELIRSSAVWEGPEEGAKEQLDPTSTLKDFWAEGSKWKVCIELKYN